MSTTVVPFITALCGLLGGTAMGALITGYFSSRNSREDREQRELLANQDRHHRELQAREEREHREHMAYLEDWWRQRDEATQLVRSSDPGERKRGFKYLRTLEDDAVAPEKDRKFVQQIRELAEEGIVGRAMFDSANTILKSAENLPTKLEPMSTLPIDVWAAGVMNQRLQDLQNWIVTGSEQFRAEGIQMYGGLPPDQRTGQD